MKTKLVNRYYCEFCKKGGCSASHMSRHEKRCTNNPNRTCGMCAAAELKTRPMADLLAAVAADVAEFERRFPQYPLSDWDLITPETLLEAAKCCPACALAAIRQSDAHGMFNFDFKGEVDAFWKRLNADEGVECHHG